MLTHTPRLALALAGLAVLLGPTAVDAYPPNNNNAQQMIQRAVQQQQRQQQEYARALQQRNQAAIKRYQDAMKKQQQAYADQMKKLKESGVTNEQLLQMQRQAMLAQVPRSSQSALKRRWAREDRVRKLAIERAKRAGKPVPDGAADGGLNLGGLGDLKLE